MLPSRWASAHAAGVGDREAAPAATRIAAARHRLRRRRHRRPPWGRDRSRRLPPHAARCRCRAAHAGVHNRAAAARQTAAGSPARRGAAGAAAGPSPDHRRRRNPRRHVTARPSNTHRAKSPNAQQRHLKATTPSGRSQPQRPGSKQRRRERSRVSHCAAQRRAVESWGGLAAVAAVAAAIVVIATAHTPPSAAPA